MALMALADNVRESTTSTGASATISLGGATSTSVRTFVLGCGNGKIVPLKIDDGAGNWENRWGTIVSGTPDTITYVSFISSSTGSAVTFGAGTKTVSLVPMYELFITPAPSPALAETTIASATTTDLGTSQTLSVAISGTTTITGFGSATNTLRFIRFSGTSLVLTYNATSLITPTGANIQTAAGDTCVARSDGSGNWTILNYQPYGAIQKATFSGVSLTTGWTQMASLSLTPGKWMLTGGFVSYSATSGYTEGNFNSTSASNSGTVFGVSDITSAGDTVHGVTSTIMQPFDVTLTTTTTYYFNGSSQASGGGFGGQFRAERKI